MINEEIKQKLFALQDREYREFQKKLIPDVGIEKIIGVRLPEIKKLASEYQKNENINGFLSALPHDYFDENSLHVFLTNGIKDFDEALNKVNEFLPFVDNWANCDSLRPKIFSKNKPRLKLEIEKWIDSGKTYTIRFGVEMAMTHFLGIDFDAELCEMISKIDSSEYYVKMMIAWYFATALAKNRDLVLPYLTENKLDSFIHNKTIQKACESFRITKEDKTYLKSLKK